MINSSPSSPVNRIPGTTVDLRLVAVEDAEFILSLRLEPAINRFMSPVRNDVGAQARWIEEYLERNLLGLEYYFIIESKQGEKLGTVRMYDIESDRFTWGSWMVRPGSPKGTGTEGAMLMYRFAFYQLNLSLGSFYVSKGNPSLECHKRMGAQIVQETESEVLYEIRKSDFESIDSWSHSPRVAQAK